ncbi:hypothetical protein EON76_04845 [bacterium]|nr:MAG: hypothetical protein EON76_04845 [bacterium]
MIPGLLQLVRLSRLFDAAYPIVSVLVGAAIVGKLKTADTILLIIAVAIFNSVAMIWNDIEDKKIDADNGRPELLQSSGSVIHRLQQYTLGFALLGLAISWYVSLTTFVLGIVVLCVIWLYNSKPVQASRRPVLSIIVLSGAGAFMPYLFGVSQINSHTITPVVIMAGMCWWLGRVSLSLLKDYKDARGDALHHKKTFLLRYGARWVARISVASFVLGYGGFIAVVAFTTAHRNIWILLVLLGACAALIWLRRPLFAARAGYAQLDTSFRMIAQYQLLLDVGIIVWLV